MTDPINDAVTELDAFFAGQIAAVGRWRDGGWSAAAARPVGLLPGAFNPLHEGHRRLAKVAADLLGGCVAFELSVHNVDKPPLTAEEVHRRLAACEASLPVWLTRAATFEEKARLFQATVFIVGADTAERVVDARYYGESVATMHASLDRIARERCRFLVAGRADRDGRFVELEHLAIPDAYVDLFQAIPRSCFEVAISSTRIREDARQSSAF